VSADSTSPSDRPRRQSRHRRLLTRRLRHLDRGRQTTYPVEEVTIAGNLLKMYADIEMIGSESTSACRLAGGQIAQMTVAGA
jgi:predicted Zn-dependent protease